MLLNNICLLSQNVNMVDLAEPGDPGPLWCAYIGGTDAFKHMYSEPEAAEGFFLRPKPMFDKSRKNANGEPVRIYGEVRRGIWWEKADKLVSQKAAAAPRIFPLESAVPEGLLSLASLWYPCW